MIFCIGQTSQFWRENMDGCEQKYKQLEDGFVFFVEIAIIIYMCWKFIQFFFRALWRIVFGK